MVTLKNIQIYPLEDRRFCAPFEAKIFFNGQEVGSVENNGKGGDNEIRVEESKRKEMEIFLKSLPPVKCCYGEMERTLDAHLCELMDVYENS